MSQVYPIILKDLHFDRAPTIEGQITDKPGRSTEAKWIGYFVHHVVGNEPNEEGYREFHRRLGQVWNKAKKELRFPAGSIENQLAKIQGRSMEAKWVGYLYHHAVENAAEIK